MPKEFETKILNIDAADIKRKLRKLGAKEKPRVLMRRWVYDMMAQEKHRAEWIRLRDNGRNITLAYKYRQDFGVGSTEELEVEVADFEKVAQILSKLSFYDDKYYQENKRQVFSLDDIEFSIDRWPRIPPLLEVESTSEAKVKRGLKLLGLGGKDVGNYSIARVYDKYGIDLHKIKELKYDQ